MKNVPGELPNAMDGTKLVITASQPKGHMDAGNKQSKYSQETKEDKKDDSPNPTVSSVSFMANIFPFHHG